MRRRFTYKSLVQTGVVLLVLFLSVSSRAEIAEDPSTGTEMKVRPFPYPYQAMVAVDSDADHNSPDTFRQLHDFVNTRNDTELGLGLGLDVGDSVWMYGETGLLSWFEHNSGQPAFPELVADAIRKGEVDVIHSYGNFETSTGSPRFSRGHAIDAINALLKNNLQLRVWTNHGGISNIQNIGPMQYMQGGVPQSPAYHADILLGYGIRFIWNPAFEDEVIHGPSSPAGARSVLKRMRLEDGQSVWGYRRLVRALVGEEELTICEKVTEACFGDEGSKRIISWAPRHMDLQISDATLQYLVDNQLFEIFAQHLPYRPNLMNANEFEALPLGRLSAPVVSAFRRLKRWQDDGLILLARTSRLLEYNRVRDHMVFDYSVADGRTQISIKSIQDPVLGASLPNIDQLWGITFYVADPSLTDVYVGGYKLSRKYVVENKPDDLGPSLTIYR